MRFRPVHSEREALEKRLKQLTGSETIRGTPLEAIAYAARASMSDDAFEDLCKQAGFESRRFSPLLKYKLTQFLTLERDTANAMTRSTGTFEAAIHRLGGAAVDVFFESVAGRTMKILAEGEPHRMLGAVSNGYGLLVNFGRRNYTRTGERTGEFTFEKEHLGVVHTAGVFENAFDRVYGLQLDIEAKATTEVDFTFRLSW